MAKAKCGYCGKRAAKRFCPSLDKLICSVCCGENRLKNIDCDEGCRYLDNELYQQKVRKEKELNLLLENVPIMRITLPRYVKQTHYNSSSDFAKTVIPPFNSQSKFSTRRRFWDTC